MENIYRVLCLIVTLSMTLLACLSAAEQAGGFPIRHDLSVTIVPDERRITAEDTITVPDDFPSASVIYLHRGLNPATPTEGVSLARV